MELWVEWMDKWGEIHLDEEVPSLIFGEFRILIHDGFLVAIPLSGTVDPKKCEEAANAALRGGPLTTDIEPPDMWLFGEGYIVDPEFPLCRNSSAVEQGHHKALVGGSNPSSGTIIER